MSYPPEITEKLLAIYEDMIWLANRPHVTEAKARAWYSAIWAEALKTKVRIFSGKVSEAALRDIDGKLCLEHYSKLSENLTKLVARHIQTNICNSGEFLELIEQCEKVNITTSEENRIIQTAHGDYNSAGVQLVNWQNIPLESQRKLWNNWLYRKVANASEYRPDPECDA